MSLDTPEVRQLVETVWSSVLGWEAAPGPDGGLAGENNLLTGSVGVRGAWEGEIRLECPAGLARDSAGVLFATEPQAATDEEVRDALGELANMIGGNLKCLLPSPSQLDLSAVATGPAAPDADPAPVLEVPFQCGQFPFMVKVHGSRAG